MPDLEIGPAKLSSSEWAEVKELADNLESYTSKSGQYEFSVHVPGCGGITGAVVDILSTEELIEVKSVQRTFQTPDLRQVLTYSALLRLQDREVNYVTLLNPRRGRVSRLAVSQVVRAASGMSTGEFFGLLTSAMSELQVSG